MRTGLTQVACREVLLAQAETHLRELALGHLGDEDEEPARLTVDLVRDAGRLRVQGPPLRIDAHPVERLRITSEHLLHDGEVHRNGRAPRRSSKHTR